MQKKLLIFGIFTLLYLTAAAQSVSKMSFQAVVRNANNELLVNEEVQVIVSFMNNSPNSATVYSEQHRVRSNQNGLISLLVGDGTILFGDFQQITWNNAYIKTEITFNDYTTTDTKPATAVPLAYYAQRIPLQALQEHLGSTDWVSNSDLRDSLQHYLTNEAAQIYFNNNNAVSTDRLYDTLRYYVTSAAMSNTLQNISDQLTDLQSITNKIDEFIVPSSPNNTFTLSFAPMSDREVLMFVNGIFISSSAFTFSANRLTYLPSNNGNKQLVANDRIQIYYYYQR